MQLCKLNDGPGRSRVGCVQAGQVQLLLTDPARGLFSLSDLLFHADPLAIIEELVDDRMTSFPVNPRTLLAPIDRQEVWAAGVTYRRSKEARETESKGASSFYDRVYSAERPELFFKANPERVVGPGGVVRVRRDSKWSVPEPELAVYVSPDMRIVGYGIGNDVSARDIEGDNPLYLPQAKVYDQSCALGPVVTLPSRFPPRDQVVIELVIERSSSVVFRGSTRLSEMVRTLESLVDWLGRENSFPNGAVLLTGTGVVPPDDFTLKNGDRVSIEITGIGKLINMVA
jgi:2-dehydro-3-deoxy-D-arabinonate dehydratase